MNSELSPSEFIHSPCIHATVFIDSLILCDKSYTISLFNPHNNYVQFE